uniref:EGF-like domain-containing protein n=1 Tax=Triticum aestivum TaxID=4565 RepID=A0A077RUS9_WHEAT|nr:unnamed protein product [Triticum aestivum]
MDSTNYHGDCPVDHSVLTTIHILPEFYLPIAHDRSSPVQIPSFAGTTNYKPYVLMPPGCWFLVFASAWWLPLMLVAVAEEEQVEGCFGSAKRCGNMTISNPFWLTNNMEQKDRVVPRTSRIDPINLNLILYYCTEEAGAAAARWDRELKSTEGYSLEGCIFAFLPVLGVYGEANASKYVRLINDGVVLTWQQPSIIASLSLLRYLSQVMRLVPGSKVHRTDDDPYGCISGEVKICPTSQGWREVSSQLTHAHGKNPVGVGYEVFRSRHPGRHHRSITIMLLLIFASFLRLPSPGRTADPLPCSHRTCGDLNIAYPFWLEEDGQPPCGSPYFQLNCNGSQALLSRSMLGSYQVLQVFPENSCFITVDNNLPLDNGCPKQWFNISLGLGLSPFVISNKNRELLVLDNCSKQVTPPGFNRTRGETARPRPRSGHVGPHLGPWGPAPRHGLVVCGAVRRRSGSDLGRRRRWRAGSSAKAGALRAHEGSAGPVGLRACHRELAGLQPACRLSVVPVLGFPDGDGYVSSMRQGFLLEWTVRSDECPKCKESGGQCRYADDGTGFSCSCSDGVRPDKCGSSGGVVLEDLRVTYPFWLGGPPAIVRVPNLPGQVRRPQGLPPAVPDLRHHLPTQLVPTNLGLTPFGISATNQELFFLYNCIELRSQPPPPSNSFACLARGYKPDDKWSSLPRACRVSMMSDLSVLWYEAASRADYRRLMKCRSLFEYTGDDCNVCKESGGLCRINITYDIFKCHCSDRISPSTCGELHTHNSGSEFDLCKNDAPV